MILMIVLFWWVFFSFLVGWYATRKGHSGIWFSILSLLLSPLVAFLLALAIRPNTENIEKDQIASGKSKRCPHCAEVVNVMAKVCRFCGRNIPELLSSESSQQEI